MRIIREDVVVSAKNAECFELIEVIIIFAIFENLIYQFFKY